jgi:hypothetical protein
MVKGGVGHEKEERTTPSAGICFVIGFNRQKKARAAWIIVPFVAVSGEEGAASAHSSPQHRNTAQGGMRKLLAEQTALKHLELRSKLSFPEGNPKGGFCGPLRHSRNRRPARAPRL